MWNKEVIPHGTRTKVECQRHGNAHQTQGVKFRTQDVKYIKTHWQNIVDVETSRTFQQVAQLWHKDRAKLDKFLINVQRYSQSHAQNCIFVPSFGGIRGNIWTLSESFNAKRLCSSFIERMTVLLVKQRISVSQPPFAGGGLRGVTYAIHL